MVHKKLCSICAFVCSEVKSPVKNNDMLVVGRLFRSHCRRFSSLPNGVSALPLPALSPTMVTGTIANWNVQEGTSFDAGTVLCEVETDKATVDYEAVDSGILARIILPAGSKDLKVGTPIALIADSKEAAGHAATFDISSLASGSSSQSSSSTASASPAPAASGTNSSSTLVGPAAAILCKSHGVDISTVAASHTLPSGHHVVTKADALQAVQGKSVLAEKPYKGVAVTSPAPAKAATLPAASAPVAATLGEAPPPIESSGPYTDIPLTTMRTVIAKNLTEAKQSRPHYYATVECNLDQAIKLRKMLKTELGSAPSINDIVIRAAALALRDVPRVNCRLQGEAVVQNKTVDVSVAVATPSGLITPIITGADKKGLMEISSNIKELAGRAKLNKLKLEEFVGGSFTVSNLGMFGVSEFTAIINPPQSAILAVGSGSQEFECQEDGSMRPTNVMTVQLSADRRVIDDVTAGQFLQCFQTYISKPSLMNI